MFFAFRSHELEHIESFGIVAWKHWYRLQCLTIQHGQSKRCDCDKVSFNIRDAAQTPCGEVRFTHKSKNWNLHLHAYKSDLFRKRGESAENGVSSPHIGPNAKKINKMKRSNLLRWSSGYLWLAGCGWSLLVIGWLPPLLPYLTVTNGSSPGYRTPVDTVAVFGLL